MRLRAERKGLKSSRISSATCRSSGPTSAPFARSASTCCRTPSSSPRPAAQSPQIARTGTRRSVVEREGHRPRHPQERDSARHQEFGQGSLAHQTAEGGTGLGSSHHQGPDRAAWRHVRSALGAPQGHGRDHNLAAQARARFPGAAAAVGRRAPPPQRRSRARPATRNTPAPPALRPDSAAVNLWRRLGHECSRIAEMASTA